MYWIASASGITFAREKNADCRIVFVLLPIPIFFARSIALILYSWMLFFAM